jgi:hypothetical protein
LKTDGSIFTALAAPFITLTMDTTMTLTLALTMTELDPDFLTRFLGEFV